jgi:hypothetical protein
MGRCDWCNSKVDTLEEYTDAIGSIRYICKACRETVDRCECRKCGATTDPLIMVDGLCTTCIQAKLHESAKKKEEVRLGVDPELTDVESGTELTEDDFQKWLTLGKAYSPQDMAKSQELKRIWIMVKLGTAGISNADDMSEYIDCMETLLDRNFSKLVGNRCNIIVAKDSEGRRKVRQSEIIDYEKEVYIVRA